MAEALTATGLALSAEAGTPDKVPATTVLVIENMHCGACMRTVERTLTKLPGVIGARVNLSSKRVAIQTVEPPASADAFLLALQAAGFPGSLLAESDAKPADGVDQDYLKRLAVAGFAAANIMLLSVSVWSGYAGDMPPSLQSMFHWLSAAIALPAIAYAGKPFFASAHKALSAGRLNMDVPISLGVTLATAMSLFQTIRQTDQVYFDAAVSLLFFLLIGRVLDQRMRSRAASAAENLLALRAPVTTVIGPDGGVVRLATSAVEPGARVVIAAGERVPVDAVVLKGAGDVDESLITGESRARRAAVGDQLYAGTTLLTGPIEAQVTAAADNTLLAEIGQLMLTAEQARGRYVRLADRAARMYAPAVHVLGLATFIGWLIAGHGWEQALTAAIAVLIITCPCALALAVPAVQVAATGRLFREGVVLKAADGLERLAEVDTIVLDKTGTLTLGQPRVTNLAEIPVEVLRLAAGLAGQSRHPYAKAVAAAAQQRGVAAPVLSGVEEVSGEGLRTRIDGREVRLGSARFCGVEGALAQDQALWWRDGDNLPCAFRVADALRPDAAQVVAQLKARGFALEILSGDGAAAVADAARAVGIDNWRAAQKPDEKIARIMELKSAGHRVLMVGDGLNDAPALAAGNSAMSPSSATDVSQTAADAVFQGERLAPVPDTIEIARATRRRSLENFAIAIGYNLVFVPLAMAGLVTPLIAAIAMSASSIAVTLNALRLVRWQPEAAR